MSTTTTRTAVAVPAPLTYEQGEWAVRRLADGDALSTVVSRFAPDPVLREAVRQLAKDAGYPFQERLREARLARRPGRKPAAAPRACRLVVSSPTPAVVRTSDEGDGFAARQARLRVRLAEIEQHDLGLRDDVAEIGEIRAWAKQQKLELRSGPTPPRIIEAYLAAHPGKRAPVPPKPRPRTMAAARI